MPLESPAEPRNVGTTLRLRTASRYPAIAIRLSLWLSRFSVRRDPWVLI